jgi:hypothetical protein
LIVNSEGAHCFAIFLVRLLGISLQMTPDSNVEEAARTGNGRIFVHMQQSYVAVYILVVGDGPAIIPAVNNL